MNAIELIDAAQAAQGLPSDYALAARLGTTRAALSSYRTGRSKPDDTTAAKLAEMAGLDPGQVIAWMHADRAKDPAARAMWESIAERLKAGAATAACAILAAGISGSPDAQARVSVEKSAQMTAEAAQLTAYTLSRLLNGRKAAAAAIGPTGCVTTLP